jgi:hypothetical protein
MGAPHGSSCEAVKIETDGDLHLALADATGEKPGIVVVEVPAKQQWEFDSPRGYSGTARGPQKFSTADQARIEIVIDRGINADALEG